MAKSQSKLQHALSATYDYCKLLNLEDETKVAVFSKRKTNNIPDIFYNGKQIEISGILQISWCTV